MPRSSGNERGGKRPAYPRGDFLANSLSWWHSNPRSRIPRRTTGSWYNTCYRCPGIGTYPWRYDSQNQ